MKIIKLFLIINFFGLPLFAPNDALNNFLRVKAALKAEAIIDDVERPVASTLKSPVGGRRRWAPIELKEDKEIDDSRSEDSE